jgi:hypothetical protein
VLCPRAFCLLASGLERAVHTVEGAARTEYVPGEPYRVKSEEARSFCNCRSSLRRRNCRYSSPAPNFAFGGHIPIPTTSQRDDVDKQFSRLHRHWRPKQHSISQHDAWHRHDHFDAVRRAACRATTFRSDRSPRDQRAVASCPPATAVRVQNSDSKSLQDMKPRHLETRLPHRPDRCLLRRVRSGPDVYTLSRDSPKPNPGTLVLDPLPPEGSSQSRSDICSGLIGILREFTRVLDYPTHHGDRISLSLSLVHCHHRRA